MRRQLDQSRHCYAFEQDFIGSWRCIPLCVRRKLDLAGVKLKLSHWLAMSQEQRQVLVDWGERGSGTDAHARSSARLHRCHG
jgi:Conserved nitrate reductase-associated protein (Nitr_red_assoc).